MSDLKFFISENVVVPLERSLVYVGINSAWKAGFATAVFAAGLYWVIRPNSAFDKETGQPRPWVLLEGSEERGPEPCNIPWYLGSALIGYGVNLII